MRAEHERLPIAARPDPDAEREVDFGRVGRTLLSRWWLVAVAVALGAVVGYLTSLGGGDVYQAKTTLYLGQPISPGGVAQVQSVATNPLTVNEIVRSEAVVRDVARAARIDPEELRRGVSTRPLAAADPARRQAQNPLMEIAVRGPWGARTAEAANRFAAAVVDEVSTYVDVKLGTFRDQLRAENRELRSIQRRLAELQRAAEGRGLAPVERLTLLSLIGLAEQRRGQLLNERTETRQLITLAETVERSAPVTEARAVRVPAQSPRSSIAVGVLIGLIVGAALALVWEPLVARRRLRAA